MSNLKLIVPGIHGKMATAIREEAIKRNYELVTTVMMDQGEVLIDFTSSDGPIIHMLKLAFEYNMGVVIGTTGFNDHQLKLIKTASKKIPIIMSSNFSIGVNIMFEITELLAKYDGYDFFLNEVHHIDKKDIPSGTANTISDIINKERPFNAIASLRTKDQVGTHSLTLYGKGEEISITHRATDRSIFVDGALLAEEWIKGKEPGLYNMKDVLKEL
jgi:4-hydroxy-tetrahydrodipicolinate reductase